MHSAYRSILLTCLAGGGCHLIAGTPDFTDAPAPVTSASSATANGGAAVGGMGAGGSSGGAGGAAATCSDRVTNGAETDVDCGGGVCATCDNGRQCAAATDCASGACTALVCGPWSIRAGGPARDEAYVVTVGPGGEIVVAGGFAGATDFGGGTLIPSAGIVDVFVAMYSAQGTHLWSKGFGSSLSDYATGVAVDGGGNVLLAGIIQGAVDFGGGPRMGGGVFDVFAVKLAPNGTHLWSKAFGGPQSDYPNALDVTSTGDALISGAFYSPSIDFGSGALMNADMIGATSDMFLAKLSAATGDQVWARAFSGGGNQEAYDVTHDAGGNIFVTGYFDGGFSLGGAQLDPVAVKDVFVGKLDSSGGHLWSSRYGGLNDDYGTALAVDAPGDVVLAGIYIGDIDLGNGTVGPGATFNAFVAKYDGSDGMHVWSRGFVTPSEDYARSVAVDSSGDVLVTGDANGFGLDFGGGALPVVGGSDVFVAKLSGATGSHLFSTGFGSTGADIGSYLALSPGSDNVVITGYFAGSIDFGAGVMATAGGPDIFVTSLGPVP